MKKNPSLTIASLILEHPQNAKGSITNAGNSLGFPNDNNPDDLTNKNIKTESDSKCSFTAAENSVSRHGQVHFDSVSPGSICTHHQTTKDQFHTASGLGRRPSQANTEDRWQSQAIAKGRRQSQAKAEDRQQSKTTESRRKSQTTARDERQSLTISIDRRQSQATERTRQSQTTTQRRQSQANTEDRQQSQDTAKNIQQSQSKAKNTRQMQTNAEPMQTNAEDKRHVQHTEGKRTDQAATKLGRQSQIIEKGRQQHHVKTENKRQSQVMADRRQAAAILEDSRQFQASTDDRRQSRSNEDKRQSEATTENKGQSKATVNDCQTKAVTDEGHQSQAIIKDARLSQVTPEDDSQSQNVDSRYHEAITVDKGQSQTTKVEHTQSQIIKDSRSSQNTVVGGLLSKPTLEHCEYQTKKPDRQSQSPEKSIHLSHTETEGVQSWSGAVDQSQSRADTSTDGRLHQLRTVAGVSGSGSTVGMDHFGAEPAYEQARLRFAALLERSGARRPLLTAVFRQLESCVVAARRLEERRRWQLRQRLAADCRPLSEAACRPRLQQLARRRQLLVEQQQQADALLDEAQQRLAQMTPPTSGPLGRMLRKWDRMSGGAKSTGSGAPAQAPSRGEHPDEDAHAPPSAPLAATSSDMKPWRIVGLNVDEICDHRRLLERERQVDAELSWLRERRDTQYRTVADYTYCLRRFLTTSGKITSETRELMKARSAVRLHAAWVREHHAQLQSTPPPTSSSICASSAELQYYDRALAAGILQDTAHRVGDSCVPAGAGATASASASAGAADAGPSPLDEKLLYARLDADESRRLVADADERGCWYQVEFALAHDRLTLTADCVMAMFVCCQCRGRCVCQWTRLARAAQRRVPDKPARSRGWGWRKVQMAYQLIRLLRHFQVDT